MKINRLEYTHYSKSKTARSKYTKLLQLYTTLDAILDRAHPFCRRDALIQDISVPKTSSFGLIGSNFVCNLEELGVVAAKDLLGSYLGSIQG